MFFICEFITIFFGYPDPDPKHCSKEYKGATKNAIITKSCNIFVLQYHAVLWIRIDSDLIHLGGSGSAS